MQAQNPRLRWLLRGGFVLALGLSLFFAVKLALGALYWSNPAHNDQPIEGWMPVGYVGRSWDVPREVMIAAAEIGSDQRPGRSLEMIARDQGIPLAELVARLETAIAAFREARHD